MTRSTILLVDTNPTYRKHYADSMIVDGKAIAADVLRGVKEKVAGLDRVPRLIVLTCAPTFATQNFLRIKGIKAAEVGVHVDVVELPAESTTSAVVEKIKVVSADADGLIVQLPFPKQIAVDEVLSVLPQSVDVDAIGSEAEAALVRGESVVLPPVVGAIAEIARRHDFDFKGKNVVIVGKGRLVGKPVAEWLASQGVTPTVVTESKQLEAEVGEADIVVLGVGEPKLLKPDMVREGVVVFDAGTSEEGGKVAGDADPAVAKKASLFTPVPGGIGPITVAKLLENLLILIQNKQS